MLLSHVLSKGVVEVRVMTNQKNRIIAGYFDNEKTLLKEVKRVENLAKGIYFTPNNPPDEFLFYSKNKLDYRVTSTKDNNIKARNFLIFDFDSPREKGVQATEEQLIAIKKTTTEFVAEWDELFPSVTPWIVFSGNGYHVYYDLVEDCKVPTRFYQYLYKMLERQYVGFDRTTHNLSRIMRLPSTYNRKAEPHRRCEFKQKGHGVVSLSDVIKIFGSNPSTDSPTSNLILNLMRDNGLVVEELEDKVICLCPNRDNHSEESDGSTSTVLLKRKTGYFFKCLHKSCEHINNEWIYSEFYGKSVVEKMNATYSLVQIKGKVRVMKYEYVHAIDRYDLSLYSASDFCLWFNEKIPVYVNGQIKSVPKGKYWIESPNRKQYENIVFDPEPPNQQNMVDESSFNLWRGWAYSPSKGSCDLYLDHIREVISQGSEEIYNYVIAWMADAIQNPDAKPGVCLVLRGGQGTGKGTMATLFGALYGQHFVHTGHAQHLTGRFNAHLKDCLLLYADEAFWAGDHAAENILKYLITEKSVMIEQKGIDAYAVRNHTRIIMASNKDWVVKVDGDDRRYCILDLPHAKKPRPKEYFDAIYSQMEDEGGLEALLHYLLHYDISDVDLKNYPKTTELLRHKKLSMSSEEEWWYYVLADADESTFSRTQLISSLYDDYKEFTPKGHYLASKIAWSRKMSKLSPHKDIVRITDNEGQPRQKAYVFHSLERCREEFENSMGHSIDWDE